MQHLPCLGEDAVAVLGGGAHDEAAGVADHPGAYADQLAAQALAVGSAVGAGVDPGEGLGPHRQVKARNAAHIQVVLTAW